MKKVGICSLYAVRIPAFFFVYCSLPTGQWDFLCRWRERCINLI